MILQIQLQVFSILLTSQPNDSANKRTELPPGQKKNPLRGKEVCPKQLCFFMHLFNFGIETNKSNCRNAAWSSNWADDDDDDDADVVDLATASVFLSFQSTDNQSPQRAPHEYTLHIYTHESRQHAHHHRYRNPRTLGRYLPTYLPPHPPTYFLKP